MSIFNFDVTINNGSRVGSPISGTGLAVIAVLLLLAGCAPDPESGWGLKLPQGDADAGKQIFVDLGCIQCHTVAGLELPAYSGEQQPVTVEIGGKVYRVRTYGELVTSITNPEHILAPNYRKQFAVEEREDAESPMPSFNERMTVAQLVDLVAFLHERYTQMQPEYRGPIY
jgi:mono/diheme cytochrome c family protein